MKPVLLRRFRLFSVLFAALSAGCLVWAVAKLQGWVGGEPLFRPVRSVVLLTFLTTMFSSWAALDRSPRTAKVLLVAMMIAAVLVAASIMADK